MTRVREHPDVDEEFTTFFEVHEPRLAYALTAAYGVEVGRESTSDAMAYAWEHWNKVREMSNAGGYLYRVGQSSARRYRRTLPLFPAVSVTDLPGVEPGLPVALASLSAGQRAAIVLVHVLEMSERGAADLLGVDRSTVRRHCERGLAKLRKSLEVSTTHV